MFRIGDVVYLKSSPEVLMTVSLVVEKDDANTFIVKKIEKMFQSEGAVECGWFNERNIREISSNRKCWLRKVKPFWCYNARETLRNIFLSAFRPHFVTFFSIGWHFGFLLTFLL